MKSAPCAGRCWSATMYASCRNPCLPPPGAAQGAHPAAQARISGVCPRVAPWLSTRSAAPAPRARATPSCRKRTRRVSPRSAPHASSGFPQHAQVAPRNGINAIISRLSKRLSGADLGQSSAGSWTGCATYTTLYKMFKLQREERHGYSARPRTNGFGERGLGITRAAQRTLGLPCYHLQGQAF